MVASLIFVLLDQCLSITGQQTTQQLKLVIGVDEAVKNLTRNLHALKAVLKDAEKQHVNESVVKFLLD
ncbi:hypothetical protein PTKIN_Ptkin05aG0134800 [Pterospermum kingtungense]